jgi:hypothetical protein
LHMRVARLTHWWRSLVRATIRGPERTRDSAAATQRAPDLALPWPRRSVVLLDAITPCPAPMTTTSWSVIGCRARKRLEKAAELLHRAVQQASVADSCHSELGELGVRRGWRDLQDVDRAWSVRDEALQGVPLREEDREYAVGAGLVPDHEHRLAAGRPVSERPDPPQIGRVG